MSLPGHSGSRTGRSSEAGSITIFVVVLSVALLAVAGLVLDGGTKLRAAREASAIAEEAARAGAGQIDRDRAYARGGRFVVERDAALRAAKTYLWRHGHDGSVTVVPGNKIRVSVTIRRPALLLTLVGVSELEVTKTAEADLLQGVDTPRSTE